MRMRDDDLRDLIAMGAFSIIRGDTYEVSSGSVGRFLENVPPGFGIRKSGAPHAFLATSGPEQSPIPSQVSEIPGRYAAAALGNSAYASSAAAARWSFLQDGSGCDVFYVFIPRNIVGTHVLYGTTSTGAAGGITHYTNAFAATAGVYAAGVVAVAGPGSAGNVTLNSPTYTEIAHGAGASPQYQFRLRGTLGANGAYAAARDSTPQHTLRLFANTPAPSYGNLSFLGMFAFNRVLGDLARKSVQRIIQREWRIRP